MASLWCASCTSACSRRCTCSDGSAIWQELLDLTRKFDLQPQGVEKDYALGWLLAAIGQHPATRDAWLFKGGTCLKKCYSRTYRFSEYLDFTLRDATHLDEMFLLRRKRRPR